MYRYISYINQIKTVLTTSNRNSPDQIKTNHSKAIPNTLHIKSKPTKAVKIKSNQNVFLPCQYSDLYLLPYSIQMMMNVYH